MKESIETIWIDTWDEPLPERREVSVIGGLAVTKGDATYIQPWGIYHLATGEWLGEFYGEGEQRIRERRDTKGGRELALEARLELLELYPNVGELDFQELRAFEHVLGYPIRSIWSKKL